MAKFRKHIYFQATLQCCGFQLNEVTMSSDFDTKVLARERKFNGGARWNFTVSAICSILPACWLARCHLLLATICAILGIAYSVIAVINWWNWMKKSEAEKAPLRFLSRLQVANVSIPCTRDEFGKLRKVMRLNRSITAIALLYVIGGILSVFDFRDPAVIRIIGTMLGIVAICIAWYCGKRFLRAAKILTCPGCNQLLTSQTSNLLKTGCCRKCGCTVLTN